MASDDIDMEVVSFRLERRLLGLVDECSKLLGITRSEVVRAALVRYLMTTRCLALVEETVKSGVGSIGGEP